MKPRLKIQSHVKTLNNQTHTYPAQRQWHQHQQALPVCHWHLRSCQYHQTMALVQLLNQQAKPSSQFLCYHKIIKITRQSRTAGFAAGHTVVRNNSKSNSSNSTASVVHRLFKVNVYTTGTLWEMRFNYDINVLSLYAPIWVNVTSSTKPEVYDITASLEEKNRAKSTGNMYRKV